MSTRLPRRDLMAAIAHRMTKVPAEFRAVAWETLITELENLSEADVPKWADLVEAIRTATVVACTAAKLSASQAEPARSHVNLQAASQKPYDPASLVDPTNDPWMGITHFASDMGRCRANDR